MQTHNLETYDVETGARIQRYHACAGWDEADACAILRAELAGYPEYQPDRILGAWDVRTATLATLPGGLGQ